MKLVFFLTTTCLLQVSAISYSQSKVLDVNLQGKVGEIFKSIERASEFRFFYNETEIDLARTVQVNGKDQKINEILDQVFAGTNIRYEILDRYIIVHSKNTIPVDFLKRMINLQQQKISGTVTDASTGEAIVGANVIIEGTTIGVISDVNGHFSIEIPSPNSILVFSFIGYITEKIPIQGQITVDVKLVSDIQSLEEIVVVGYGVQKKVNLTGSVSVVNAKELESRPITNVSTALQGLMPGATIIQNSGQPGKDMASIRIRGIGTINNANPMYVVDGMVVSSMNDIDPNDIESISILKDAASAAIYGSRAANGVILITTKKGGKKAVTLKYDGYSGWQKPTDLLEYLPSWEYAELYNKARINQGLTAAYTTEQIQKFKDGSDPDNYPNTDWLGMFYKNSGFQQSHRVELSGGNDNTTYMFSLGYFDQDGIINHANFKRYSGRTNLSTKVKKFTASLNLSYTYGDTKEPTNPYTGDMYQIFRQINRIAPFVPYKYSNGYYGYLSDGNPMAWMDLGAVRKEKYHKTRGIANVTYEPIKGLKIQEALGYEYNGSSDEKFIKDIQFYNWKTGNPALYQGPNSQEDIRTDYQMISLQTLVTYDKTLGKHNLLLLAGYSQESSRIDSTSSYRKSFLSNDIGEINAGSTDGQKAGGSANENSLKSYFGRLSYNFDEKYLFEANIRRDGTSRIHKDSRWGTFPSFSAGWRIINESFMDNLKSVVSDLKFRIGWGFLGNQSSLGNYPYQQVLSTANYTYGGVINPGMALTAGVNADLVWESTETRNIGIDLGLFNNQLTFTADVYDRRTWDILYVLPVPTPFGMSAPYQNVGDVMNKGLELQLNYKLKTGDWQFDILANAAYNKNEVTNLNNNGARIWNGFSFLQEGYPINSFGGYRALGLFRTQDDLDNGAVINRTRAGLGDIKYEDVKKDGKIDGEDRVYLGSWTPAWTFGTTLGANWKGVDFQLFFQGAAKVKGYMQTESVGQLSGNTSKPTSIFRDSYDKDTNPNGDFPRPLTSWTQNDSGITPSSFWIVDASYVRLKNVQLGYTIPESMTKFAGISKARIYYSGQNLLTISGLRKGFDPEAPAGARAYYPQVKTHSVGVSVTF